MMGALHPAQMNGVISAVKCIWSPEITKRSSVQQNKWCVSRQPLAVTEFFLGLGDYEYTDVAVSITLESGNTW